MADAASQPQARSVPIVTLQLGAASFTRRRENCALVADYLASFISGHLERPASFAAALGQRITALLVVIWQRSAARGHLALSVSTDGNAVRVEAQVPMEATRLGAFEGLEIEGQGIAAHPCEGPEPSVQLALHFEPEA